jgi:hypothetical protein
MRPIPGFARPFGNQASANGFHNSRSLALSCTPGAAVTHPDDVDHYRVQTEQIRTTFAGELQRLKFLEYELRQRPGQDLVERTQARAVSTAIEHLHLVMDALEVAIHASRSDPDQLT